MNFEDPYFARAPRYSLDLGTCVRPTDPRMYIGSGGFGDVIKGTMTDNGATVDVAIKKMRNRLDRKVDSLSIQLVSHCPFQDFLVELRAWSKLHHPNILRLLGYLEVDNTIGLVSPFIANGSATSYFSTRRTVDPSPLVRITFSLPPDTDSRTEAA
jgi:serine/threonine protein kinase